MRLADPTIPTDSTTGWLTGHGWQIVAAVVCAVVVVAIFKALPKWFFLVVLAIVGALYAGVKLK